MKLYALLLVLFLVSACSNDSKEKSNTPVDRSASDHLVLEDTTIVMFYEDLEARLNFPLITCSTDDPLCDSLIYTHLNFSKITGASIQDVVSEFETYGYGLSEIDYQVHINENGIFDISYDLTSLAAHLNYSFYNSCLDLVEHKQILLTELIHPDELDEFLIACNKRLKVNVDAARENIGSSTEEDKELILEMIVDKTMDSSNLKEFNLQKDGLAIYYDFFFPHYAKAYEPSPVIYFKHTELQNYLNTELDVVKRWMAIDKEARTAQL